MALLPINGRDFYRETDFDIVGNMDHREAARLANELGVELMVPMHWEMFASNRGYPGDLLTLCHQHLSQPVGHGAGSEPDSSFNQPLRPER